MNNSYFNFTFEHWGLFIISLLPALVNIGIFWYVFLFVKQSRLSSVFLVFLSTLIMWKFQEVVLQICTTSEAANIWYRVFDVSTNFVGATGLHFVLVFTKGEKWKVKNFHFLAIYFPTFLFSLFFLSNIEYMQFDYTENWGWVFTPCHPGSIAAFTLIGLQATIMLILLSRHAYGLRKTKSNEFYGARIIVFGSVMPIVVGCLYQIVLPVLFKFEPIPIASSLVIFFSISILVAITRYDVFEYSPLHQWDYIIENMSQGLLIVDNSDIIQFVNQKFCKMLGYSSAAMMGRSARELFLLEEDQPKITNMLDRRMRLFKDKYEMRLRRKDGSLIICEISAQPYLDPMGKVIGSVGIHSDVTFQHESARKLKDSESRYRSFVEQATDGIFIADKSGKYLDVNIMACQMLGYSKAELLKMSVSDLLFESDKKSNPPQIDELIQGRTFLTERVLKMKGGSGLFTEINARMLPNGNLLGIVRDITERKKTEEELLEKVKEMDAFIYRASHDLRGPLASVSGLTMIGKDELKNPKADFYFNKIHESVSRLDNILLELSSVARVTQAKIELSKVDLKKEVEDILESLKHLPNYQQIEFTTEIEVSSFFSDRILIIIIFQNLIINAINYMDDRKQKHFIRIRAIESSGRIELTVSDNGIGIADDIMPKVFDMFYRGTNNSKGSGLGLYIIKNAVKRLRGSISLESKVGEGTCVTVRLPRSDRKDA